MQKDIKIKQMFNNIAKNYDKLNNIISFGMHLNIKKRAINNIPLKSDFKILDICTGTGDIAIYICKNIVNEGKITGLDFSENMLKIAEEKAENIKNIEFINADALNLPFEDAQFDACFISFGLRNLNDVKKGLLEMKRVTKKGGFIVNLDTGKPQGSFKFLYKIFLFHFVPILGKLFHGDSSPYRYLPKSIEDFYSSNELVEIFKEIGLNNVEKFDFLLGAISQQVGEV